MVRDCFTVAAPRQREYDLQAASKRLWFLCRGVRFETLAKRAPWWHTPISPP